MTRNGSCFPRKECGSTSGCSDLPSRPTRFAQKQNQKPRRQVGLCLRLPHAQSRPESLRHPKLPPAVRSLTPVPSLFKILKFLAVST